jgi:DNA-binding MarR family transcriptional regulator
MTAPPQSAELEAVIFTVPNGDNALRERQAPLSATEGRWAKLSARAVADRSLTATYLRVLAYLAIHADRLGVAWPSQETIAAALGINRSTVCRAIKRLRDLGYLYRYRRRTPRGHFRNVYKLLYPMYAALRTDCASPEM